ncbi:hypothetical protein SDRG_02941 [Saprolegnia diclina VS20]|uniref:Uncharacterized protein n=1 Tax=Saprolegnia diclina (strain VS20) TaxID=1156394 RepID=T0QXW9_SAPDV|nr:hypothetical protein SDRG_02941 [Saprolegnia diclina VS20]EQC39501.1 hypothetical protein SDRG_02941 [Saprolegnia diclina VS20]|eukprot:XP_008606773.1 hypothetical protein SDRG_02941 [Saprolegnia diclina VS20]
MDSAVQYTSYLGHAALDALSPLAVSLPISEYVTEATVTTMYTKLIAIGWILVSKLAVAITLQCYIKYLGRTDDTKAHRTALVVALHGSSSEQLLTLYEGRRQLPGAIVAAVAMGLLSQLADLAVPLLVSSVVVASEMKSDGSDSFVRDHMLSYDPELGVDFNLSMTLHKSIQSSNMVSSISSSMVELAAAGVFAVANRNRTWTPRHGNRTLTVAPSLVLQSDAFTGIYVHPGVQRVIDGTVANGSSRQALEFLTPALLVSHRCGLVHLEDAATPARLNKTDPSSYPSWFAAAMGEPWPPQMLYNSSGTANASLIYLSGITTPDNIGLDVSTSVPNAANELLFGAIRTVNATYALPTTPVAALLGYDCPGTVVTGFLRIHINATDVHVLSIENQTAISNLGSAPKSAATKDSDKYELTYNDVVTSGGMVLGAPVYCGWFLLQLQCGNCTPGIESLAQLLGLAVTLEGTMQGAHWISVGGTQSALAAVSPVYYAGRDVYVLRVVANSALLVAVGSLVVLLTAMYVLGVVQGRRTEGLEDLTELRSFRKWDGAGATVLGHDAYLTIAPHHA